MGEHFLGEEEAKGALPFASPFAGGVGGTRAELCGGLTGGLMVIGGLYGRRDGPTPDDDCQALAARYREAFQKEFGWLRCCELKEHWVGKVGQESCRELVKRAAEILIDVTEG